MGAHRNVIEINGQKYDAVTGKPLKATTHRAPKAVDGFMKRPAHEVFAKPKVPRASETAKPAPKPTPAPIPKPVSNSSRSSTAHNPIKRAPQKSKTLMRRAVSKPVTSAAGKPVAALPARRTDKERQRRASTVEKSSFVSKFGFSNRMSPIVRKVEPLSVKKPPVHAKAHPLDTPPSILASSAKKAGATAAVSSAEAHIERALAKADSHTKLAKHPRKKATPLAHRLGISRRLFNGGLAVVAGLLLVGFFTYQNMNQISLRIAAARAGFDAQLPDYQPSGFAMSGPVEYGPGFLSVNFESNSQDGRSFSLSQKVSNWNSATLVNNFLNANGKQYQTFLDKGRTIYIYDNSHATWVSGGVWYQVEGDAELSSDQLLRIANSI